MDKIKIEWIVKGELGDLPHVAVNTANGMIVGQIIDGHDRVIYESNMPKSRGEQWVFVDVERAKAWVEKRYAGEPEGKPAAPKLSER